MEQHHYSSRVTSKVQLAEILQHPIRTCLFRVLWWRFEDKEDLTPDLLDVCGMGFRLPPHFFSSALYKSDEQENLDLRLLGRSENDRSESGYVRLGDTVVRVARTDVEGHGAQSTLLILGPYHDYEKFGSESNMHWRAVHPDRTGLNFETYQRTLEHSLRSPRSNADLQFWCILLLPQLSALSVALQTRKLRYEYVGLSRRSHYMDSDSGESSVMRECRFWLRRHVEDSIIHRLHFSKYVQSHYGRERLQDESYLKVEELWEQNVDEARRLDTEFRDYVHLINGQLALAETRKSIELSSLQIRESRRGK